MKADNITIKVPAVLTTAYTAVKWFKKETPIETNDQKYRMLVSNSRGSNNYTFQLEVLYAKLDDYTKYKLCITSGEKTAEITVLAHLPAKCKSSGLVLSLLKIQKKV